MRRLNLAQQKGLSLIELMISIVIALIILVGVVQVVVSSKRTYVDNQEISYIQDNTRFVVDLIAKDLRLAGYRGCAKESTPTALTFKLEDAVKYLLASDDGTPSQIGFQPLTGFESAEAKTKPGLASVINNTDVIFVRRGGAESEITLSDHNAGTNTLTTFANHGFTKGTPLMLVDAKCMNVGIFPASDVTATTVKHETIGSSCTSRIRGEVNCNKIPSAGSNEYLIGSKLMPYVSHAYFISPSTLLTNPDMPSLKRISLRVDNAGALQTFTEEIAQGVSDMQVLYGIQQGTTVNYKSADAVAAADWQNISVVKIDFTFRSLASNANGTPAFASKSVSTTVQLRNRS
jgi:type IV pilus assembly protein PilW